MENNFIFAKTLRDKYILNKIDKTKPGYYKWWADKETLNIILKKLNIDFSSVENNLNFCLISSTKYYCIYVGVAIKESVKARLNWHINQINTMSNVKLGTLSTLRQTISSLVGKNMIDNTATNNFIDKLIVEYHFSNKSIKSEDAKNEIHLIEHNLLNSQYLYILNIQDNKHKLAPIKQLKLLRKQAKIF